MRWTKLELEPRSTDKELDILQELTKGLDLVGKLLEIETAGSGTDAPLHLSKDSGDIVRDYLSEVAREWYRYIRSQGRHTLNSVPLDMVITHPAVGRYLSRVLNALVLIRNLSPGHMRP